MRIDRRVVHPGFGFRSSDDAFGFADGPHGDAQHPPTEDDKARREQQEEWGLQCEKDLSTVTEGVVLR